MCNFVYSKGSLKEQWHEICGFHYVQFFLCKRKFKGTVSWDFDFRFFYESVSPKPLSIPLGPFQLFFKFTEIFATGVIDTGGKFDKFGAGIIDSGGKFTKMGRNVFFKFTNRKSANSWAQFVIANPQISKICEFTNFISAYLFWLICKRQILKFRRWASPLIANPQI